MSEWLEIALPYPPSVNHYWRHTKNGRHYIRKDGLHYKATVKKICEQFDPFKGAVQVQLWVYYPDKRQRDPDNLQKALWDSLVSGGLIEDDNNQVLTDVRIRTAGIIKGGMVILKIKSCDFKWGDRREIASNVGAL